MKSPVKDWYVLRYLDPRIDDSILIELNICMVSLDGYLNVRC